MRFTVASVLAFASAALAQTAAFDAITQPTKDQNLEVGGTYPITWEFKPQYAGKVTLKLLGGATPSTLEVVSTIQAAYDNSLGKFDWSVPASLGDDATYGIKIEYDSDPSIFQYSFPFHIKGGAAKPSSSSSSSAIPTYPGVTSSSASSATTYPGTPSTTVVPTTSAGNTTTAPPTVPTTFPAHNATTTTAPGTAPVPAPHGNRTTTAKTTSAHKTTTLSTASSSASASSSGSGSESSAPASSASTAPSSTPSAVNTNGAAGKGASLLALIGGVAVAVFAL